MTITHTYDPALWQLVPREPTKPMLKVMRECETTSPYTKGEAWTALLAAAPPPPAPQTDDARMREFEEALDRFAGAAQAYSAGLWGSGPVMEETRATVTALYAAALQSQAESSDRLAYEGAREDLLDWKRRAQAAEAKSQADAEFERVMSVFEQVGVNPASVDGVPRNEFGEGWNAALREMLRAQYAARGAK